MDLGENPCLLMINGSIGMFLRTEEDDIVGATPEPVCEGVMLVNDSSQTACQ